MTKSERAIATRLAEAIKRGRKALGWSQGVLAERLSLTTNYVSLLERAERLPSVDVLVRLSVELGVPIAAMVGVEQGADEDPWTRDATTLLRAVPLEARPVVLGMLRGVTAEAKPQGLSSRTRRR